MSERQLAAIMACGGSAGGLGCHIENQTG